ncbi:xylitol dehydrogenase [Cadophora sp. DSE1049]|nr:xylitol dehydrogenase [Cadophora sp. DSE1049]
MTTNCHYEGSQDLSDNRSVVWVAPEKLEVQHRDVPELKDDDVLVEVIATGICGSDAHVWASNPAKPPPVLGHESAGRILKVGSKVTDRQVGQRVAVEPGFPCMKCEFCVVGKPNVCANLAYCGHTQNGTLQRFVVCPASVTVPIPENVSWKSAGSIQPLAIAVQLGRRANMRAHQTVAVFGCGPLGLLIMGVARAYGVKKIIAFDVEQSRVDFAVKYGADVGILSPMNTSGTEPLEFASSFVKEVVAKHKLGSGVDLTIEASGAEACVQMGVHITKPGGMLIQAGLGKPLMAVPLSLLTAKELTMKGTVRYTPGCFADAIDLLARGAVDLESLVTSTYPLTRINDAFVAQKARKDIKIVVMNQE